MKRAISFVLIFAILVSTFSACSFAKSNDDVTVDESVFLELNSEQDSFSGTSFYYPSIPNRKIKKDEFTRLGTTNTFFMISSNYNDEFTVLPVIRYVPDATIPYQLECVFQYRYTSWGSYSGYSFGDAIHLLLLGCLVLV